MPFKKKLSLSISASLLVLLLAACGVKESEISGTESTTNQVQNEQGSHASSAQEDNLVLARTKVLDNPRPQTPSDLVERLKEGGLVIFHRYTGATRGNSDVEAVPGTYDDGQRISGQSIQAMQDLGRKYQELGIPVETVYSSEYFFVWQHANEAFKSLNKPIQIHRDFTGSLSFTDPNELEVSLQGLRNRTVTPPSLHTNTVFFTHQGKFDKAFGYYPDAGWTMIFQPDGSGIPKVIANMPLEEFLALQ